MFLHAYFKNAADHAALGGWSGWSKESACCRASAADALSPRHSSTKPLDAWAIAFNGSCATDLQIDARSAFSTTHLRILAARNCFTCVPDTLSCAMDAGMKRICVTAAVIHTKNRGSSHTCRLPQTLKPGGRVSSSVRLPQSPTGPPCLSPVALHAHSNPSCHSRLLQQTYECHVRQAGIAC